MKHSYLVGEFVAIARQINHTLLLAKRMGRAFTVADCRRDRNAAMQQAREYSK